MKAEEYRKDKHPLKETKVIANISITEDVYILTFEKNCTQFLPGQVLHITPSSAQSEKPYSLCSSPNESTMSVLFNEVTGGELTPHLAQLKAGDSILVSEPFGSFVHGEEQGYWIAAGTGVAPFHSMMVAGLGNNPFLVHGGKYKSNFYFEDEFQEVLRDRYVRCCSREEGDQLFNGRLTSYLLEQNTLSLNYKYYLCGSPQMVVEVRDILISKGIPFDKIAAEIYF